VAEIFSPEAGNRRFWSEPWERRKLAYELAGPEWAKVVVSGVHRGERHGSGLEADCEHELLRSPPDEVVRLVIAPCASNSSEHTV